MHRMKERWGDGRARLMTRLANRTFKNHPNVLDRMARRLLSGMVGKVPHDPELDHPDG